MPVFAEPSAHLDRLLADSQPVAVPQLPRFLDVPAPAAFAS